MIIASLAIFASILAFALDRASFVSRASIISSVEVGKLIGYGIASIIIFVVSLYVTWTSRRIVPIKWLKKNSKKIALLGDGILALISISLMRQALSGELISTALSQFSTLISIIVGVISLPGLTKISKTNRALMTLYPIAWLIVGILYLKTESKHSKKQITNHLQLLLMSRKRAPST